MRHDKNYSGGRFVSNPTGNLNNNKNKSEPLPSLNREQWHMVPDVVYKLALDLRDPVSKDVRVNTRNRMHDIYLFLKQQIDSFDKDKTDR